MDRARDALEDYFRNLGLSVVRLSKQTSFGNVEYVESKDALIVAHSHKAFVGHTDELYRAFGESKYVLMVWLDQGARRRFQV